MSLPFNHRHLYYFWVVAKEGSMSRAAERLDMAVQTVSAQVRELEKSLGQQLLKIADDITAEYKKFAKENLHKVSVFKASREGSAEKTEAVFSTQDAAERAIARSGF